MKLSIESVIGSLIILEHEPGRPALFIRIASSVVEGKSGLVAAELVHLIVVEELAAHLRRLTGTVSLVVHEVDALLSSLIALGVVGDVELRPVVGQVSLLGFLNRLHRKAIRIS